MAEQYVERRGGRPWLAWIIILIIIAFIVWLFVAFWGNGAAGTGATAGNGAATGGYNGPATPGAPAANGVGVPNNTRTNAVNYVLTNPNEIAGVNNKLMFVGRQVRFDNVAASNLEGKGFWIGSGDNRLFVLPTSNANGGGNGAHTSAQVKNGQKLALDGVVERLPAAKDVENNWGLNAQQAAQLERQQVYIGASTVAPAGSGQGTAGNGAAQGNQGTNTGGSQK